MMDAKCDNCQHSIYDTVWGEYKCKLKKRACTESELVMGCSDYKQLGTRPDEPTPEMVVRSGATFTPNVSEDGLLSWTNDKGLENPKPVNIRGKEGVAGKDGKDGYTPIKGVDYFDGEPGKDGKDGVDGRDGKDGIDGRDGTDGADGEPGKDGYTPVKGVDYWNEGDISEINARIDDRVDPLKKEITQTIHRVSNLEYGLATDTFETDAEVAYVKTVPENALPYAAVSKVGGMTRKCTNLIPFPYSDGMSKTHNGVTFTVNEDGSIHAKGTATGGEAHFYLCGRIHFASESAWAMNSAVTKDGKTFKDLSYSKNSNDSVYIGINDGKTVDKTFYPMINYGTTALPYEPYFEGLRSAPVTELRSEGANLVSNDYYDKSCTKEGITFTVHEDGSVTANGTATARADFYLKYTISHLLTLKIGKTYCFSGCPSGGSGSTYRLVIQDRSFQQAASDYGDGRVFEARYADYYFLIRIDAGTTVSNLTFKPMLVEGDKVAPFKPYRADVVDTLAIHEAVQSLEGYGESNPDDANEYNYIDFEKKKFVKKGHIVDGVWVRGEIETDISEYLTDDNFIEVEGSGTITAVNEHEYAVPSEIIYQMKEVAE